MGGEFGRRHKVGTREVDRQEPRVQKAQCTYCLNFRA